MNKKELVLTESQIRYMVCSTAKMLKSKIKSSPVSFQASDTYGPNLHRTWVFTVDTLLVVGSIERYWGGLKMISSTLQGSPRTYFFTEEGERSNSKALKGKEE